MEEIFYVISQKINNINMDINIYKKIDSQSIDGINFYLKEEHLTNKSTILISRLIYCLKLLYSLNSNINEKCKTNISILHTISFYLKKNLNNEKKNKFFNMLKIIEKDENNTIQENFRIINHNINYFQNKQNFENNLKGCFSKTKYIPI